MNNLKGTITVLEKLPFSYGEFIDFIGGRTWAHFSAGLLVSGENHRLAELRFYESRVSVSNRYLSDSRDPRSRECEIIYLKLCAFIAVSEMVKNYRRIAKCSFGYIDDKTFAVSIEKYEQIAPSLWGARFAVVPHVKNFNESENVGRILAVDKSHDLRRKTSDEYALGVLLLRTFIINHRNKLSGISVVLDRLLIKIRRIIKSESALARRDAIENCLEETLDEQIFSLQNLYYKPKLETNSVDINSSWKLLLLAGLRLICHDCVKAAVGMDSSAISWLSIDSVLSELSDIRDDVKRSTFTGVKTENESLPDILRDLILDQQWLELSLSSLYGNNVNELNKITNVEKDSVGANTHNEYMKDLRAMLVKNKYEKNKIDLGLNDIDPVSKNRIVSLEALDNSPLKSTLIQKASWLRERD